MGTNKCPLLQGLWSVANWMISLVYSTYQGYFRESQYTSVIPVPFQFQGDVGNVWMHNLLQDKQYKDSILALLHDMLVCRIPEGWNVSFNISLEAVSPHRSRNGVARQTGTFWYAIHQSPARRTVNMMSYVYNGGTFILRSFYGVELPSVSLVLIEYDGPLVVACSFSFHTQDISKHWSLVSQEAARFKG